ncbi:MAG: zf-HC2 domain-containing protein [Acidobacteria bacterium]|nr:zf-HC2 domain-containing protein [Acidobacteriota bacterium]
MNCERSHELFADYLGAELARGEAQELQLHLKTCQGCRQELALLGSAKATLKRALPEVAMPQHLSFNFSKPQPQGWFQWLRQPRYATLAAATACFVICVASLALSRAQLKLGSEGVQISFGSSDPTPAAPAPVAPQVAVSGLGKEEVQRLIEAKLSRFEEMQKASFDRGLLQAKKQWQMQRGRDMQQMYGGLRYLESNQKSLVQDAARNSSYVQSLASNLYAKAEGPASVP